MFFFFIWKNRETLTLSYLWIYLNRRAAKQCQQTESTSSKRTGGYEHEREWKLSAREGDGRRVTISMKTSARYFEGNKQTMKIKETAFFWLKKFFLFGLFFSLASAFPAFQRCVCVCVCMCSVVATICMLIKSYCLLLMPQLSQIYTNSYKYTSHVCVCVSASVHFAS